MEVVIDKNGWMHIPKQIREELGIAPGDTVELRMDKTKNRLIICVKQPAQHQEIKYTDWGFPVIQTGIVDHEYADTVKFLRNTYNEYFEKRLGF